MGHQRTCKILAVIWITLQGWSWVKVTGDIPRHTWQTMLWLGEGWVIPCITGYLLPSVCLIVIKGTCWPLMSGALLVKNKFISNPKLKCDKINMLRSQTLFEDKLTHHSDHTHNVTSMSKKAKGIHCVQHHVTSKLTQLKSGYGRAWLQQLRWMCALNLKEKSIVGAGTSPFCYQETYVRMVGRVEWRDDSELVCMSMEVGGIWQRVWQEMARMSR